MKNSRTLPTIAAIAAAAGLAIAAPVTAGNSGDYASATEYNVEVYGVSNPHFKLASDVMGMDVTGTDLDSLGSVDDIIINQGSGVIEYLVVRHGGLLGIGGDLVAIPFGDLGYDSYNERFLLNTTDDRLETMASFDGRDWRALDEDGVVESLRGLYRDIMDRETSRIALYDKTYGADRVETVSGTLTGFERFATDAGTEYVAAEVFIDTREVRSVVLGPSWYVLNGENAPMRGDTVEITYFAGVQDDADRRIASGMSVEGTEISLRSKGGSPLWDIGAVESTKRPNDAMSEPLIMVSELIDRDVEAMGQSSGEVQDVVVELASGSVPVIAVDPNTNLFGINDDLAAVPWTVISISSDTVRVDATRPMLDRSEPFPSDVVTFGEPAYFETVFTVFEVEPNPVHHSESTAKSLDTEWSHGGVLSEKMRSTSAFDLTGTISQSTTVQLPHELGQAKALVISTDDGERTVVVGPADSSRLEDLADRFGSDDTVALGVKTIALDGQEFHFAQSISAGTAEMILWDRRTFKTLTN